MKRFVSSAFALSGCNIFKVWQAFSPDGFEEDARRECIRLIVDGMLPLVASPNVLVLTSEGMVPLSDIRQGDEVVFYFPGTERRNWHRSDDDLWEDGRKFAMEREWKDFGLLSAPPESIGTFINAFESEAKGEPEHWFNDNVSAFFFHLAASKARGTVAPIDHIGGKVAVPRPSSILARSTVARVVSVDSTVKEIPPFAAFVYEKEARRGFLNGYTVEF